jgi:hypothetical protein
MTLLFSPTFINLGSSYSSLPIQVLVCVQAHYCDISYSARFGATTFITFLCFFHDIFIPVDYLQLFCPLAKEFAHHGFYCLRK